MVHWTWLILALIVGALFGIFVMCLMFTAGRADAHIDNDQMILAARKYGVHEEDTKS